MFLGVVNFVGGWIGDVCKEAAHVNRTGFVRGAAMPRPTLWLYGERDAYYSLDHSRSSFESFSLRAGRARGSATPRRRGRTDTTSMAFLRSGSQSWTITFLRSLKPPDRRDRDDHHTPIQCN
jgi:hypothetical protein